VQVCPESQCISHVAVRTDLFQRDPNKTPITDFFGSVRNVELLSEAFELVDKNATNCDVSSTESGVKTPGQYFYASQLPADYIST